MGAAASVAGTVGCAWHGRRICDSRQRTGLWWCGVLSVWLLLSDSTCMLVEVGGGKPTENGILFAGTGSVYHVLGIGPVQSVWAAAAKC